jgi:hypothetical protein
MARRDSVEQKACREAPADEGSRTPQANGTVCALVQRQAAQGIGVGQRHDRREGRRGERVRDQDLPGALRQAEQRRPRGISGRERDDRRAQGVAAIGEMRRGGNDNGADQGRRCQHKADRRGVESLRRKP